MLFRSEAAIAALSRVGAAAAGILDSIEINPLIALPGGAIGVDVLARRAVSRG